MRERETSTLDSAYSHAKALGQEDSHAGALRGSVAAGWGSVGPWGCGKYLILDLQTLKYPLSSFKQS